MSLKKAVRTYAGHVDRVIPDSQLDLSRALASEFHSDLEKIPDAAWTYGLAFAAKSEKAFDIFSKLKSDSRFAFDMLVDVTAVDWMDRREPRFDVVYQLLSISKNHRLMLKIAVSEDTPEVPSFVSLWHAADFLEREVWDMYGIRFTGHPNLKRIMMYEEFVGHPLRKDYPINGKQPRIPLRIPELRNTSQDMHKEQLVSLPSRTSRLRTPQE